jgi:hypothetical protein
MKSIVFFIRHFLERGTEKSIYDYAHYNEVILKNKSYIACFTEKKQESMGFPKERVSHDKFKNRFQIFELNDMSDMEEIIWKYSIDFFYTQTGGGNDIYMFDNKKIWRNCKTIKHCVFETTVPEGDFYISISDFLNKKNNTNLPVIPLIVNMPECSEDLRSELNIPADAVVLGRHGGKCQFDIPLVHQCIKNILEEDPNIYFLFMNTDVFYSHPRIIYLDASLDDMYKAKFINTCSAMIHARSMGETFGLAVAEFSVMNKPVITGACGDLEHINILKNNGLVYDSDERLMLIFRNIRHILTISSNWNSYTSYTPGNIMRMFDRLIFNNNKTYSHPISFSIPLEKIVTEIPVKTKVVSSLIPGKAETYIYNTEESYYNEYKTSVFAKTIKKAGWDCMRHYEILACGCIPYFPDIGDCPVNTMSNFPKNLILEGNRLYEKYAHKQLFDINMDECANLISRLLDYTRMHLTTAASAKYILEKVGVKGSVKILFLSGNTWSDYLRDLVLHGFKQLIGSGCHESPRIDFLYKSDSIEYDKLYGKGMSYTNLLENNLRDVSADDRVREDIINNKYDLVIYGNMHRGMPLYPIVSHYYSPDKIVLLCGNDIHDCNYDEFTKLGHHVFIREL